MDPPRSEGVSTLFVVVVFGSAIAIGGIVAWLGASGLIGAGIVGGP